MNAERLVEFPNVEDIPTQEAIIRSSNTLERVTRNYRAHFHPGVINDWLHELAKTVTPPGRGASFSPDHARLITLVNNQGAQFGYDSMEGQFMQVGQYSSFDPRRELALASYISGLNLKANEHKEKMSDRYEQFSEKAAIGVWGVLFVVKRGEIIDPTNTTVFDSKWYEASQIRGEGKKKVLVPNHELSRNLAGLEFSLNMAETMDDRAFDVEMMPRIVSAIGHLLDPELAFYNSQRSPLRYYSYPNPDF